MLFEWFGLSLRDGALKPAKEPDKSEDRDWDEWAIENLIALNPSFLGVDDDHMPLRLGGVRGTWKSPDLLYVDELGRIVVVEVKKVTAGLNVIAQAIAYAEHWRLLPPIQIDEDLRCFANKEEREEAFGRLLLELQKWDSEVKAGGAQLQRLGRDVLRRLNPKWAHHPATDITSFAQQHCGDRHPPLAGAPARIVVLAPDFKDECVEFAGFLAKRKVGIELVKVSIVTSRKRTYVGRKWVRFERKAGEDVEPTWQLLRRAWRHPQICERFDFNGWADGNSWDSFSLSARGVADARFWLWASDKKAEVCTCVPDGWYTKTGRRKQLREKFLDALPVGFDRSERYPIWEYELPAQKRRLDRCVLAVAKAVDEVLVPANPIK
jgi:hypothetical protein